MAKGYQSPGVKYIEKEILSPQRGIVPSTIGVVGGATKGPLGIKKITSIAQLRQVYGNITANDYGLITAEGILKYASEMFYCRVVSERAKKGTAGVETTDEVIFTTLTDDSTLNGATVQIKVDATSEEVDYQLMKGKTVLEKFKGFSAKEDEPDYFIKEFNKRSEYLEVKRTAVALTGGKLKDVTLTIADAHDGIEGLKADNVIGGIEAFSNPESIDVSILIAPGWSDPKVHGTLGKICQQRGECMTLIDLPKGLTVKGANDFVNGVNPTNEKWNNDQVAVYWPWGKMYSAELDLTIDMPPSAYMGIQYAYSDSVAFPWSAVAGFGNSSGSRGRGVITELKGLEYYTNQVDRDNLYGEDNVINPVVDFQGKGIVAWGNKNTKRNPAGQNDSQYSKIHIRRLSNYVRKLVTSISLNQLFNPNDPITWEEWRLAITPRLREIKDTRGIADFKVVMDETTVTEQDQADGRMPGIIYVRPVNVAEFIPITYVATQDGVIFREED